MVTDVHITSRSDLVHGSASRIARWCHRKLRRWRGGTDRSVALSTFTPSPFPLFLGPVPLPPPERPHKSSAVFHRHNHNQLREADEGGVAPLQFHGHDEQRTSILYRVRPESAKLVCFLGRTMTDGGV